MTTVGGQIIGIVGGVGPQAGIDLASKITSQTSANSDQGHLPVVLLSLPARISERTAFLVGTERENPGVAIAAVIEQLERCGAGVVGIPCNTAHAPPILDIIKANMTHRDSSVTLLDMVAETVAFLRCHHGYVRLVGVLATTGAQRALIYPRALKSEGLQVVVPTADDQERIVHPAIVDEHYGIKACASRVSPRARNDLLRAVRALASAGAEAIILGCTEIPLAVTEREIEGVAIIDPTMILARALIRAVAPEKLMPRH